MIRKAAKEDIPVLVEMSSAMHQESPRFRSVPFDAKVMGIFLGLLMEQDGACVFVSEDEGKVVGMFAGLTCPYFFSLDSYSCDIGLYVVPDMRGKRHAFALIRVYEEWAAGKGVKQENITLTLGASNEEKMHEFFRRLGYVEIGALYRKGTG